MVFLIFSTPNIFLIHFHLKVSRIQKALKQQRLDEHFVIPVCLAEPTFRLENKNQNKHIHVLGFIVQTNCPSVHDVTEQLVGRSPAPHRANQSPSPARRAPGGEEPVVRVVRAQEPGPGVGGLREGRRQLPVAPPRRPRRALQLVRRHRERREPHRRHGRRARGGRGRRFGALLLAGA